MRVRPERPEDFDAIHSIVAQAFGREDEATLVRRLRAGDAYVPDLAFVAEQDGEVVGHIMLTYAKLDGARVLSLAPLSVKPDCQRAGIGIALTKAALERADARGEPLVVVLGHPTYYPRFGFEPARPLGIEPSDPNIPDDVFMVVRLRSYDPKFRGQIVYPSAFESTT
jgi:putative acetyltransferase